VERLAEIPVAAVVVERRDSALYKLEHVSGALDDSWPDSRFGAGVGCSANGGRSDTVRREGKMVDVEIRRFERADETRTFELGTFDVVSVGGVTVGRASYRPGWVWSEHVGKATGDTLCPVEHVGLVVSGRAAVKMEDGSELELTAGDLFHVAPGHDSWVIGDEPYVSLHFLGAMDYAKR
jgi:hypothetical protein